MMSPRLRNYIISAVLALPLVAYAVQSGRNVGNADDDTQRTVQACAATITSGQATLSTAASQVVALSTTRRSIVIRNNDASISIYVGVTGVTSSTGVLVKAGESISINTTAAIFAVAASATPTVSYLAESD